MFASLGVTDGIAFLLGVATGAAGKYLADKYTDKRRRQERSAEARSQFAAVLKQVPDLIREMSQDFQGPDGGHVREVVLLPQQGVIYNPGPGHTVFAYFADKYPNLRGQFAILENYGYVVEVGVGNTTTFRLTENFIERLKAYHP